jgi:hypothetical protein
MLVPPAAPEMQSSTEPNPPPYEDNPPAYETNFPTASLSTHLQHVLPHRPAQNADSSGGKGGLETPWQTKQICSVFNAQDLETVEFQKFVWLDSEYKRGKPYVVRTKLPQSFMDLVDLTKIEKGMPRWTQIPYIMCFPEFIGYNWRYKLPHGDNGKVECSSRSQMHDNLLVDSILAASGRTQCPPLCSPDFFLYRKESRESEMVRMFNGRSKIVGVKWHLEIQTNHPQDHPDFPRFCQYLTEEVPTGEWLIEPIKWDKKWFARMVVERVNFEARQEIVDLVASEGYHIEVPNKSKGKKRICPVLSQSEKLPEKMYVWEQQDKEIVQIVAWKFWTEWRMEAEHRLEAISAHS